MTPVARVRLNETVAETAEALNRSFGENDLIVARRQVRETSGEALQRWQEVVEIMEMRRGWR